MPSDKARAVVLGLALIWPGSLATAGNRQFSLGPWTGFTEFGFMFRRQDHVSGFNQRSLFSRSVFEERIGFRNTAIIVDPRLASLNFGLTLGFDQTRQSSGGGQTDSGNGRIRGFDLALTVLPSKPYTFTVSASESDNVTPVEFAGSRELRNSSLGLSIGAGPGSPLGHLSYRSYQARSTSDLGLSVRGIDQTRDRLTYTLQRRWRRHEIYTFLQHEDLSDRVARDFSSNSVTGTMNHELELLAPNLVLLRTSVHYFDRSGELSSSVLDVREELRLRHSDSLSSGLQFELRNLDSFSGRASESWRGTGWVHHQLWESLETDLRLSRLNLTSEIGRSELDEARLRSQYRKRLPHRGNLIGTVNAIYDRRDNPNGDDELLVSQERHTARFGVSSRLERPRVVPGSIVVTDELGVVIYEEGVDHEFVVDGEFTEMLPLPGGRIQDGQVLLVDYRALVPAFEKFSSLTTNVDLSLDYGWVVPFAGYRKTRERQLAGLPNDLLEDRKDLLAGVRFRVNRKRFKLFSYNEWRSRDSRLLVFDSLRFAQSLTYSPGRAWTLTLHAVRIATDFESSPRSVRIHDGRASVRWRPLATLDLGAYSSARITRDNLAADQTFKRFGLEARWNLGKISLISSVELWRRSRDSDQLDGTSASLRISRRFFPGRIAEPRRPGPSEGWPGGLPGSSGAPAGEPDVPDDGELIDPPEDAGHAPSNRGDGEMP